MKVKMTRDLNKYKPKFIAGLTVRQALSLLICILVVVPSYFFLKKYLDENSVEWIILLIGGLILAFGWVEYQGLTFEKILLERINTIFILPKTRYFKIEDEFEEFLKEEENNISINKKKRRKKDEVISKEN